MSAVFVFAAAWHPWYPWHVALAVTMLCAVLYLLARVQLERATEDWANAYLYSPSQKSKRRRRRWQHRTWALLGCTVLAAAATPLLYWHGPR
jgi:Ca2+/Na+ antiporter